jgi:hypothetical protein
VVRGRKASALSRGGAVAHIPAPLILLLFLGMGIEGRTEEGDSALELGPTLLVSMKRKPRHDENDGGVEVDPLVAVVEKEVVPKLAGNHRFDISAYCLVGCSVNIQVRLLHRTSSRQV